MSGRPAVGATATASATGSSAGFLLFLTFLILQLTHVIDWSWWWITAPLWIPSILGFGLIIILGTVAYIASRGEWR